MTLSVMALFCEDIREEKDGIVSLIGIIPDTINLMHATAGAAVPSGDTAARVLSKLCIYTRINFEPEYDLREPELRLALPNGEVVSLGKIEATTVRQARSDATTKGAPLAGVISRAVLAGFRAPTGTVKLEVIVGDETYLAGAITFQSTDSSSTASPPPS